MDPLSIASSVVSLTGACLKASKTLSDIAGAYQDVPTIIASICAESTTIGIALAQLQGLLLRRQDLADVWKSRSEVTVALDTALTGCVVIFSCIEDETRRVCPPGSQSSQLRPWAKIKFMWNQNRLKELLDALRGQQTALNLLIQLLQIDALSQIQETVRENRLVVDASKVRTQTLRASNPSVRVASSIFGDEIPGHDIFGDNNDLRASVIAPSELDFDFDDMVLNSQAYRRAFAMATTRGAVVKDVPEGDLIDLTDSPTTVGPAVDANALQEALNDLKDLQLNEGPARRDTANVTSTQSQTEQGTASHDQDVQKQELAQSSSGRDARKQQNLTDSRLLCGLCQRTLTGQFVRALGQTYHFECFTCMDCNINVASRVFPVDDGDLQRPLCEKDYFRRLGLLCHTCGGSLRDNYITALNHKYHVEHFQSLFLLSVH